MPILSVCIPTYNRAEHLAATLDSLLVARRDFDVEIVISDNASSDTTLEVCRQYVNQHPNIVYTRNTTNLGADLNYLKVVSTASGSYCWLFGSDDIAESESIARILKSIESGSDVYILGFMLCDGAMNPKVPQRIFTRRDDFVLDLSEPSRRKEYFETAVTSPAIFSFLGSLVFRKSVWDESVINIAEFNGSLWIHVAKFFQAMKNKIVIESINSICLYKRGDNDSFMDKGLANRLSVQIAGFHRLADYFFVKDSIESLNIKRIIRNEIQLRDLLFAKILAQRSESYHDIKLLNQLACLNWCNAGPKYFIALWIFRVAFAPIITRAFISLIDLKRLILRELS
ncbi:hypothetical protein SIID45300_02688 [Candidatus Magnetaquicoccaceae bacterium FCR-1]|uniref:Glycosyltransferase 2-like domain-containing protein n=1 Tax=Candidatus Magnetaquiglobus chichijimensis TaxID=3141448 RepID=A0ABQ0CCC1_9PROT